MDDRARDGGGLVRNIDKKHPTLLLDETDAAFKANKEYAEALRGVLNCGHERGGAASLCVGQGANIEVKDFDVFCPKAIAGIGELPDTVADRAIPILLKRKTRAEYVERFRRREVEPEAAQLCARIITWITPLIGRLRDARPALPEELTDRQQDGAEPLIAIADAAGGDWPEASRRALVDLCAEARGFHESTSDQLLSDIRQIFGERDVDRISSAELISGLTNLETSLWSEYSHGKPLSQAKLARLLAPFGIVPNTIRIGPKTAKGYMHQDFQDAFGRYLPAETSSSCASMPLQSVTTLQGNTDAGSSGLAGRNTASDVTDQECEIDNTGAACDAVTVTSPLAKAGASKK